MIMAGTQMLAVLFSCSIGLETDKANQLVSQANSTLDEGKKYFKDAEEKKEKMLHTDVSHLAEARAIASDAIRDYDQAEAKAKDVAAKFEEASKLKLSDVYKQYLELKTKEYNKRVELISAAREIPKALIDSENRSSFISKANAATERANKLNQEASDISDQADKLEKDNPDIFKK